MNTKTRLLALSLMAACAVANAAGGKEAFRSAGWRVVESVDAMTDEKECTAIYKNNWDIQSSKDTFFISMQGRGGVKAYKVRVGSEPVDDMRLADDMEQKLDAVILESQFSRIYKAQRLRVQVVSVLSDVIVEDIDLRGFKASIDYMKSHGCS